ncbi:zf-HC2 domain-containing protein, partial [bacterium]|nr:zf-HC2 domain-containing protein [bacterium]
MSYRLSCEQISALINFYAEGELSEILTKYVKEHLETCPKCMEKYNKILEIMK